MMNSHTSHDEGETLIELIIAVAIMGIAVVAIVGGIATAILMSDVHRKQATAGAYVRNYAEAVETYVAAGHYDASASPSYPPGTVGFAAPAGFTAQVDPLHPVKCWNSTGRFDSCAAGNTVQQVTLQVTSTDLRASESVAVVVQQP
jgi:Tfp pilus assembly protein PilV